MDNNHIKKESQETNTFHLILLLMGLGGIFLALSKNNLPAFILITLCPLALILGIQILRNPVFILYFIFIVNYFIMGITRYIPIDGVSVIMDILYVIAIILIFIHAILYHNIEWKRAITPLSIGSFIWLIYCIAQLVNPTGVLEGWILSRGLIINGLTITIITSLLCTRYKSLQIILFLLAIFTTLAIIKTIMQKYIGFDPYESAWVNGRGRSTHLIRTGIRYFSFFTDASNLGSNMGCASIIFGLSAFYIKNKYIKIFYAFIAIGAIYAMLLSGTRGAIIVPIGGLTLFTIISKNIKVMLAGSFTLIFIYIFFAFTLIGQGNPMIRRMRTAFNPTEDASFNVRKENQKKLGAYLKSKPFGEGLGLSGDGLGVKISNRFTTSIPSDSWYVKIWVETGIVGLILYISMILISIGWGAWILMFKIQNTELKGQLCSLLCGIAGMFASAYGNLFWGQFPTMLIAFIGITLVLNGEYFDRELNKKYQL